MRECYGLVIGNAAEDRRRGGQTGKKKKWTRTATGEETSLTGSGAPKMYLGEKGDGIR